MGLVARARLATAVLGAVVVAAAPVAARAEETTGVAKDALALLPDDAAVYALVRPADLADGFAFFDLLTDLLPAAVKTVNAVRDRFGFYALVPAEFTERGFDAEAPILGAWGRFDRADWAAQEAWAVAGRRKRAGETAPPLFVRHRVIVRIADAAAFRAYVVAILSNLPAQIGVTTRTAGDPPRPAWWSAVEPAARRAGLQAVAVLRGGGVVTLRGAGPYAIVDVAEPWAGSAGLADPKKDLPALLPKLGAGAGKGSFLDHADDGAHRLLGEPVSLAAIVEPARLTALLPKAACRRDFAADADTLVSNAGLAAVLHPFKWRLDAAMGLTTLGRARLTGLAADDGLLDPRGAIGDAVIVAGLLIGALDNLRTVPSSGAPVAAAAWPDVGDRVRACGLAGAVLAGTRFAPELFARALDHATKYPAARSTLSGARNIAGVARQVPESLDDLTRSLGVLLSFDGGASMSLLSALEMESPERPERSKFGNREPTFYELPPKTGFALAGVERLPEGRFGLALAPLGAGLGWYYKLKSQPALSGTQPAIGYLHLNVERMLALRAETADEATRKALRLAGSQLGILGGPLVLQGDLLRLRLALGPP